MPRPDRTTPSRQGTLSVFDRTTPEQTPGSLLLHDFGDYDSPNEDATDLSVFLKCMLPDWFCRPLLAIRGFSMPAALGYGALRLEPQLRLFSAAGLASDFGSAIPHPFLRAAGRGFNFSLIDSQAQWVQWCMLGEGR